MKIQPFDSGNRLVSRGVPQAYPRQNILSAPVSRPWRQAAKPGLIILLTGTSSKMAKRVRLARVESLERQQAELATRVKAARQATRQRQKEDDARRCAVLGAALFKALPPKGIAELIEKIVPDNVKAKADLILFKQWLSPAQIAAGEGEEQPLPKGAATKTG